MTSLTERGPTPAGRQPAPAGAGVGVDPHLPRGGRRVRQAGDAVLRRQGLRASCCTWRAKAFWPAPVPFALLHVDTGHNFPEVLDYRDECRASSTALRLHGGQGAGLHRRRPAARAARRHPQPAADRPAARRHRRRASTTPCSAAAAATRSGPGPRSGSSPARRVRPVGPAQPAPRAVGRSTTAGTCPASTSGCSRCPTGPSWTSGTTSRPRRSSCRRSTTPTSGRSFQRDGMWLAITPVTGAARRTARRVERRSVRYRTVGDMSCTGAVLSDATTVRDVITEVGSSPGSPSAAPPAPTTGCPRPPWKTASARGTSDDAPARSSAHE